MDYSKEVAAILDDVLMLKGRISFAADTPLLGAIPELDSMAVVGIITALEERLGVEVQDDDIDGSTFTTFGVLVEFVRSRLEG